MTSHAAAHFIGPIFHAALNQSAKHTPSSISSKAAAVLHDLIYPWIRGLSPILGSSALFKGAAHSLAEVHAMPAGLHAQSSSRL